MKQEEYRVVPCAVPQRASLGRWIAALCLALNVTAAQAQSPAADSGAPPDTLQQRLLACTGCHGNEGRAASDGFYPRIAGKPEGYLYNQLINFREGRRHFQLMSYMVDYQSDDYLKEMARYFSGQHPPFAPPQKFDVPQSTLDLGQELVKSGDPSRKIPACSACHSEALSGVNPAIPGLLGLPRDYIIDQLGSWKSGSRRAAAPDCMGQIAGRLTTQQIGAIAAWIGSQTADNQARPADHAAQPLPLDCGGVPASAGSGAGR